jgi:site-specific DNA recombinase
MEKDCVVYLRVSSDLQVEGYGLDRQLVQIAAYAKRNNLKILRTYEEVFTGTSQDRPVLQQLLQEDKAKLILIESADRFSRSCLGGLSHLMTLALDGFNLIDCSTGESLSESLDGHPVQRFLLNVRFAVSQYERDLIAHRLAEGRRSATKQNGGQYVAGRKSSYSDDFKKKVRRMRKSKTWREIAKELNAAGSTTANDLPWTGRRVRAAAKTKQGRA